MRAYTSGRRACRRPTGPNRNQSQHEHERHHEHEHEHHHERTSPPATMSVSMPTPTAMAAIPALPAAMPAAMPTAMDVPTPHHHHHHHQTYHNFSQTQCFSATLAQQLAAQRRILQQKQKQKQKQQQQQQLLLQLPASSDRQYKRRLAEAGPTAQKRESLVAPKSPTNGAVAVKAAPTSPARSKLAAPSFPPLPAPAPFAMPTKAARIVPRSQTYTAKNARLRSKFGSSKLYDQSYTRVLLTGGLGQIGAHALREMCRRNVKFTRSKPLLITVLNLRTPEKERAADQLLAEGLDMNLEWCDLTDPGAVCSAVKRAQPDVVVHLASVVPPEAYCSPKHMWNVNVNGTKHLLQALASELTHLPFVVLASSTAVLGASTGLRSSKEYTADSKLNPMCSFGHSKAVCEQLLRSTWKGPWAIARLGASMSHEPSALAAALTSPEARQLFYTIPFAQRRHGCDQRDVGLALANACVVDPQSLHAKVLYLVGDDTWKRTAGDFHNAVLKSVGAAPLPAEVFRETHL